MLSCDCISNPGMYQSILIYCCFIYLTNNCFILCMNCLLSNPPICLFELYLVKKTINPLNEINVVDAHGLYVHYPPVWPALFHSYSDRPAVPRPSHSLFWLRCVAWETSPGPGPLKHCNTHCPLPPQPPANTFRSGHKYLIRIAH